MSRAAAAGEDLGPAEIQAHLDQLTKPPGSLGRLEQLAARLCLIQQTLSPAAGPRKIVLFAGDHGVVADGVSAWPADVTGLMIRNIATGGAASSALARASHTELAVIDVGSLSPPLQEPVDGYLCAKVREGTRSLAREAALTAGEWRAAWEVGSRQAAQAADDGFRVVAGGEMGIGNTTPASCLAVLLAGLTAGDAVGRGAGSGDRALERKREIVGRAARRARGSLEQDPEGALAAVGGLEIAALAGFYAEAAARRLTVVLDGFIATAAALASERLRPGTARSMIAAHRSDEPGHGACLEALGLEPMLEWRLRLGEGTGALLLMPLLDAAAAMVSGMRTFSDLGIEA
ncbi:MAG: nicotinate-nucleotide--dimethylbenzimidazole phosphoribosyltransferase [Acidobacteriota bacterium]